MSIDMKNKKERVKTPSVINKPKYHRQIPLHFP